MVVAVDVRERDRQRPGRREAPVERRDPVAIARLDLVVVRGDLADGDTVPPMARLVEVDVLVAQVESGAGLDPRALRGPVGVDDAERGAAAGGGVESDDAKR